MYEKPIIYRFSSVVSILYSLINFYRKAFLLNKLLNPLLLYLASNSIKLYKPPIYYLLYYFRIVLLISRCSFLYLIEPILYISNTSLI